MPTMAICSTPETPNDESRLAKGRQPPSPPPPPWLPPSPPVPPPAAPAPEPPADACPPLPPLEVLVACAPLPDVVSEEAQLIIVAMSTHAATHGAPIALVIHHESTEAARARNHPRGAVSAASEDSAEGCIAT